MAFIFTCGTHNFTSLVQGCEHITVQCQNCGNFSGKIIKQWEWFTFCFVPIIPFSLKPWRAVHCHICRFNQDIQYRPDVQQQIDAAGAGAGGAGGGPPQNIPLQGAPQGWNQGLPPPATAPQGQPQYK